MRNAGLEYAEGKYIAFLECGDWLDENALEDVRKFFCDNYSATDVVSIPISHSDNNECENQITESEIVDLKTNPDNPQFSINSAFIKREAIENAKFDNNLICSADTLFLNEIMLNKMNYGILNTTQYHCGKPRNLLGYGDDLNQNFEYYTPRIKGYHLKLIRHCLDKFNTVPDHVQHLLIADMAEIVKLSDLDMFKYQNLSSYDSSTHLDDITADDGIMNFKKAVFSVMEYLDDEIILNDENICDEKTRNFLLYLKHGLSFEPGNNNVSAKCGNNIIDDLKSNPVRIEKIKTKNSILKINGCYSSYCPREGLILELLMENENSPEEVYTADIHERECEENTSFLSRRLMESFGFEFNVALNDAKQAKFKIRMKHEKYTDIMFDVEYEFINQAKHLNEGSLFTGEYKLTYDGAYFSLYESFNIAVVMAIYNTEYLVREAIDSVINQTLDFKENIQLILVDDGSKDNSLKICEEYQSQYPENIVVLSQENSGQAKARNNGIEYANAKYVNFLDSDDYFSLDSFEKVYNFFEDHNEETDIVSIPIMFFGRFEREHPLNFKYKQNRVIDLNETPYSPQFHANSSFFNSSILEEFQFPLDIMPSEDAVLINKILLKKRTLGVVKDCCYYYRKREDETSSLDLTHDKDVYYTIRLKKYFLGLINYAIDNYGCLPKFLEYTLAHDLSWMLFEPEIAFTDDPDEIEEFKQCLHKVLSYISPDTIENLSLDNDLLKSYYLHLKSGSYIDIHDGLVSLMVGSKELDRVNYHKFWLDIVEINKNYLDISGLFMGLFDNKYLSIEAVNEMSNGNTETTFAEYRDYPSRDGRVYLSERWQYAYNFDIRIPVYDNIENNVRLRVNYHIDGDSTNFSKDNVMSMYLTIGLQPFANLYEYSDYMVKDNKMLLKSGNVFKVSPYSYMDKLKYEYACMKKIKEDKPYDYKNTLILRGLQTLLFPFRKYRKTYLFMDRKEGADDNAEVLWYHALKQKDGIRKYFVINRDSPDYERLSKRGKVISFGSFRHKLLYLLADKIISSHPEDDVLNPFFSKAPGQDIRRTVCGLTTLDIIFLQHGVIYNNLSIWLSKFDKNVKYFLTSSYYEKAAVVEELNYREEVYHVLGLPRFDNLENRPSRQILICPTWRYKYMGDKSGDKYKFLNSDYYRDLNELLGYKDLINLARENDCRIIFKPHPRLLNIIEGTGESYVDLLDVDENIEIASDKTYNEVLCNCDLMITDTSSVEFDFAYMEKPLIYYQPNEDWAHEPGYFKYDTMGFGPVVNEKEELVKTVEDYIKSDFKNKEKYLDRIRKFFPHIDKNNCERVYKSINEE